MLKYKNYTQLVFYSIINNKCPYSNCTKIYATEVSLNLHIKLKHQGGTKTEREKYAVCFIY